MDSLPPQNPQNPPQMDSEPPRKPHVNATVWKLQQTQKYSETVLSTNAAMLSSLQHEQAGSQNVDQLSEVSHTRRAHGASLVVWWLRTCLPTQGTQAWSLVLEDPTCCGATKPISHSPRAHTPGTCAPQWEQPPQWAALSGREGPGQPKVNLLLVNNELIITNLSRYLRDEMWEVMNKRTCTQGKRIHRANGKVPLQTIILKR